MTLPRMLTALTALYAVAAPIAAQDFVTERAAVRVVTVAAGLDRPWSLAFLPDGPMLVTERPGRLRVVSLSGDVSAPVAGLPPVFAQGQGGLLDVVLDPDHATNGRIYLSYAEDRGGSTNATVVMRARLAGTTLEDARVIFRQEPAVESPAHFGGRLVFDRDGRLFVTLGERSARHFIDRAQLLDDHFGKIVRIERDGEIPADNPFVGHADARPEIWSYGHRNPQGAALHPVTGELWSTEHGPKGGDELNIARAGRNYGWPVITYGTAYSGETIGIRTHREGMEQPIHYWVPSIATSGLAFYTSDRIPGWTGSLFVGGLAGRVLSRLELDGERVRHEERLFETLRERIRDVRQGPDGFLYLLTDSPQGRLLRIEPAANDQ
jgi:glucose/arabinose dehydrogenase